MDESINLHNILSFALEIVKMSGGKLSLADAVKEVKKAVKEADESINLHNILSFALEIVKMSGRKLSLADAVKEVKKAVKEFYNDF